MKEKIRLLGTIFLILMSILGLVIYIISVPLISSGYEMTTSHPLGFLIISIISPICLIILAYKLGRERERTKYQSTTEV